MTDADKQAMLTSMTGETDSNILSVYLTIAQNIVLAKAYPFAHIYPTMPSKYDLVQVDIAAFLLNKRGAEGETSHSENGVNRSYESGDIPAGIICRITPMASPIKGEENADETTS